MEYRQLGRSGIAVSQLCLGTMTFGNTTNQTDSIRMIHNFMDLGGNFIDTADVYVDGRSEEIVGEAIRERRSDVILATKVRMRIGPGVNQVGVSRKHIMESIDASLRRLGTDYVDLYQVHVWDHITPIEETLRALDDLVSSGKIRYIGCSNYFAWQLMKSLCFSDFLRFSRFISIQPQYSLVNREMDREVLPLCIEEGVGVIPWAPLGGGFLTGKYSRDHEPTEGRLSSKAGESRWEIRNTVKNFLILDEVQRLAKLKDKSPAQVSLNWLMNKPGITSPIFGARTLEQFTENMGAIGWKLSESEWNSLNEASELPVEYPERFIEKFKRSF